MSAITAWNSSLRLLLSFAFGGIALLVLYYVFPPPYIGRGVLAIALALRLHGVAMRAGAAWQLVRDRRLQAPHPGAGRRQQRRADQQPHAPEYRPQSFVVVGFMPVPGQTVLVPDNCSCTEFGLAALAEGLHIDEIVVAPDERRGVLPMEEMLICAQRGVTVTDLTTFFEREAGMVKLNVADPSWLVFSGGFDHSLPRRLSKRFFDLAAAGALLLVAWPVMLVVAVCMALESRRPDLLPADAGRRVRTEFRTGQVPQHARGCRIRRRRALGQQETTAAPGWAASSVSTRLDELPQLFNVLRGDMSFVGPRPERPQFVDLLSAKSATTTCATA